MTGKSAAGVFSAGIAIGAIALLVGQRVGGPDDTPPPRAVESAEQIAALRADYDARISSLANENKALFAQVEQSRAATAKAVSEGKVATLVSFEEFTKRSQAAAKQVQAESLLAAGYSSERIDFLRRRAQELAAEFRQSITDRLKNGLPLTEPQKDLGLRFDPDILLRYEIGDSEYERYLTALKRPTAVGVREVLKGSIADGVGVVAGDQIVSYDNKRVFNRGELDGLSLVRDKETSAGLIPLIVRRDGGIVQLMVPKGPLGVLSAAPNSRQGGSPSASD